MSPLTRYYMFTILALFLASEVFCVILIYLILSVLRQKTSKFSKATIKLHFQFTFLLAFQLMTPLLLVMVPVSICLIKAMQNEFNPREATQLGLLIIGFYGLVNSLYTILFVTPYRQHFLHNVIYPWLKPLLFKLHLSYLLPRRKESWTTTKQPRRSSIFVFSH